MPLKIEKTNKLIDLPVGFTCDCCKYYVPFSSFRSDGINTLVSDPEFIAINHHFGYESSVDLMKVELTICEPCLERYCKDIDVISTTPQVAEDEYTAKPILYIDMDDTICDFKSAWHHRRKQKTGNKFPQSKDGFFLELQPIAGAIESVNALTQYFDVYILTAPSYKNPQCYIEKRLWIEKYFGLEFCKNLIICAHKNLLTGDYLIDDNATGKGQENFRGELIQFGTPNYPSWQSITAQLLSHIKQCEI